MKNGPGGGREGGVVLCRLRQFAVRISSVAVVEGRFRGHGDPDLSALELDAVEPLEGGVGGAGLLVLDDAVALGLAGGVVLVDPHGEGPLVLVAPLLLSKTTTTTTTKGRGKKEKRGQTTRRCQVWTWRETHRSLQPLFCSLQNNNNDSSNPVQQM